MAVRSLLWGGGEDGQNTANREQTAGGLLPRHAARGLQRCAHPILQMGKLRHGAVLLLCS